MTPLTFGPMEAVPDKECSDKCVVILDIPLLPALSVDHAMPNGESYIHILDSRSSLATFGHTFLSVDLTHLWRTCLY